MPTHKNYTKTEEVEKHLKRYKSIDRITASSLFKVFHLSDMIRRLRSKGYDIRVVPGSSPNTKYKLYGDSKV